jgi:hypothetical protein
MFGNNFPASTESPEKKLDRINRIIKIKKEEAVQEC